MNISEWKAASTDQPDVLDTLDTVVLNINKKNVKRDSQQKTSRIFTLNIKIINIKYIL